MAKYRLIPKSEAAPYSKQIRLVWHTGVQAIEIDSGDFIFGEICMPLITEYPVKVTIADKELSAKTELLKYPLVDEKDLVFKTYEMEVKKL